MKLSWNLSTARRQAYEASEANGAMLWAFLHNLKPNQATELSKDLGIYIVPTPGMPASIPVRADGFPVIEIHSVRPARRIGSNGQQLTDLVIEMVQRYVETDPITKVQTTFRGGCTLLIDLEQQRIRYAIRKRVDNANRIAAMKSFAMSAANGTSPYFLADADEEPFAMLHRGF
jgi:hypothetical protein